MASPPTSRLDISHLDGTVHFFCSKAIADSTHKTYQSALRRFGSFCSRYGILSPFPVSEALLCYYASFLATQQLSPQTIKTYLAAIRYMQIILGLPEPRAFSSLPLLRLVQTGIQRTHLQRVSSRPRVRLPVSSAILTRIKLRLFRSGEITVPNAQNYDPSIHLSWGDLAVDNPANPTAIRVHLKQSKCDQFGQGVNVFVGRTNMPVCPVAAVLAYIAVRGAAEGPFFQFANGQLLSK